MLELYIHTISKSVSNRGCFTIFGVGESRLSWVSVRLPTAVQSEHLWQEALPWICLSQPSWLEQLERVFGILVNKSVWSVELLVQGGLFWESQATGLLLPPPLAMASCGPLHRWGLWAAPAGALPARTSYCLVFPVAARICTACLCREICTPGQEFQKNFLLCQSGWASEEIANIFMCHDAFEFLSGGVRHRCEPLLWMGEKPKAKPFPSSLHCLGVWTWTSWVNMARRFCSHVFSHHLFSLQGQVVH